MSMIDKISTYCKNVNFSRSHADRATYIYEFFQTNICPETIRDVFIGNLPKKRDKEPASSMWLFSDEYLMEAEDFLVSNKLFIVPYKAHYIKIFTEDYSFEEVDPAKSRFDIYLGAPKDYRAIFNSHGKNCSYLKKVYLDYLKPKLIHTMV